MKPKVFDLPLSPNKPQKKTIVFFGLSTDPFGSFRAFFGVSEQHATEKPTQNPWNSGVLIGRGSRDRTVRQSETLSPSHSEFSYTPARTGCSVQHSSPQTRPLPQEKSSWNEFLHAMISVGLQAMKVDGSVWQFQPTQSDVKRKINFTSPIPRGRSPTPLLDRSVEGWPAPMVGVQALMPTPPISA